MARLHPPKIIVMTPVRNEAWILPRFLATSSQWADLIIVSDQKSSDDSRRICSRFDKVHLIENSDKNYSEDTRQLQLIETARALVPGPRILFGLDADEILAADALATSDWSQMLHAPPGILFRFPKPDLYPTVSSYVRMAGNPHRIAYVDDGRQHVPSKIHSPRVPVPSEDRQFVLNQIKVLHYAYTRPRAQRAKVRMYSVLENVIGRIPNRTRLWQYRRGIEIPNWGPLEQTPAEWFAGWEQLGIDMRTVVDSELPWQDIEVLLHFATYGCRRFWIDDIWDVDWEALRLQAIDLGIVGVPNFRIVRPPLPFNAARGVLQGAVGSVHKLRSLKCSLVREENAPPVWSVGENEKRSSEVNSSEFLTQADEN